MKTVNYDKTKIKVLLIGVANYKPESHISNIENVHKNIELLKNTIQDKSIIGIPEENITISINEDNNEIKKKLTAISRSVKNFDYSLFVYYTGHGIISNENMKLYLTASNSTLEYLETDGICISDFQEKISKAKAGRKIVILDACHSGAIHNRMGVLSSQLIVELNKFEGTYIMTSASEEESARFPHDEPDLPTYFTGKLIDVLKKGIDNNSPFCAAHEIFTEIYEWSKKNDLPLPQQSCFQNAQDMIVCKNSYYKVSENEETVWTDCLANNTVFDYLDYLKKYPKGKYIMDAENNIKSLEEDEKWAQTLALNTIGAFVAYKRSFPEGKYQGVADQKIFDLMKTKRETKLWDKAHNRHDIHLLNKYLNSYPDGEFANEAKNDLMNDVNNHNPVDSRNRLDKNRLLKSFKTRTVSFAMITILMMILLMYKFSQDSVVIQAKPVIEFENLKVSSRKDDTKSLKRFKKDSISKVDKALFDKLLTEAMDYETRGEIYFHDALEKYKLALSIDKNNKNANEKHDQLSAKIDELYTIYVNNAKIFLKAENGYEKALIYLDKAESLKPELISDIDELRNSND